MIQELNNLCAKTLVTLTNRYYNEIKNEITEITNTFLLEDKGEIDKRIRLLKDENLTNNRQTKILQQSRRGRLQIFLQTEKIANYDRIERLINTYARRLRVELLANESSLAQLLNNLNQTLLGIERNQIILLQTRKNRYYNLLYIVTERQMRFEQNKQLLADNERYDLIIQSIDEAFLDLLKTVQALQNLRRDLYNSIQSSFDVKKINNLKDAFDWLNINKIEVEPCLQEKQFLYNLKEKIIEIYSDEEKDHYFINMEEDIDIFNEDIENFINKTIKKNIIYKLIREIFKESEEKEQEEKNKKHDLDNKNESDPKKPRKQRITKKEKNYKKELISNIRPIIYRGGIENIVIPLTISSLLDLYIKVVDTNQEELKKIETIILTHLNNYPDITWFTFYKPTDKTNDFFKKAKYLTKQHYLDIVYRILVLRDLDLELDDIIENIFDVYRILVLRDLDLELDDIIENIFDGLEI
ncbi:hypothetical protein C2G38_2225453 [Gigaspora rosea]|uniref:Uncharacterized protein n=1 Tax=Gigaspora rosea TaxID=44941 RepID=A0A397U7N4_9GLOM|nr:hypothetical protein C2G38_2225453 [Gigaspora rosea]